jgi:hypothetical protein
VGFIQHDTLMAGCSPDRLVVGKKKGVEVKCVLTHVQVETILSGGYPSEHKAQIQGGMWITGFEEWDFASYSPDMPKHRRLYVYTVKRDEAYIKQLEAEVPLPRFLAEVDLARSQRDRHRAGVLNHADRPPSSRTVSSRFRLAASRARKKLAQGGRRGRRHHADRVHRVPALRARSRHGPRR